MNTESATQCLQAVLCCHDCIAGSRGVCTSHHALPHPARLRSYPPPPPHLARAMLEFQNLTETTPPITLIWALFARAMGRHKRWRLRHECTSRDSPISTPKGQERVKVGGRAATNIPQIPPPSPKSPKKVNLHGPPENGTAKFHCSKNCRNNTGCCSDKGIALAGGPWATDTELAYTPLTSRKGGGHVTRTMSPDPHMSDHQLR